MEVLTRVMVDIGIGMLASAVLIGVVMFRDWVMKEGEAKECNNDYRGPGAR